MFPSLQPQSAEFIRGRIKTKAIFLIKPKAINEYSTLGSMIVSTHRKGETTLILPGRTNPIFVGG